MGPTEAKSLVVSAAILEGQSWPEDAQTSVGDAIARVSPVETIVGAFDALSPIEATLGAASLRALLACADILAAQSYHGRGDVAAAVAGLIRPRVPAVSCAPPPNPESPGPPGPETQNR